MQIMWIVSEWHLIIQRHTCMSSAKQHLSAQLIHEALCCLIYLILQERKALRAAIIALTDRGTVEAQLPPAPESPVPRYQDDRVRQKVFRQMLVEIN
jgi:hypothetical protein